MSVAGVWVYSPKKFSDLSAWIAGSLVRVVFTDERSPVKRIGSFKNLELEVAIDAVCRHPRMNFSQRLGAVLQCVLSANERTEPRAEEEYLSMLLNVFKLVERPG